MANATDLAIRALNEFIEAWIAPAAQAHLADHSDLSTVYAAIRAIAPAEQTTGLGYAVFGLRPETHERKRESGFETVVVSAVFDQPPTRALESSIEGEPWPSGVREGLRFFGICQLQQIRT
jgi:hypothetical protein